MLKGQQASWETCPARGSHAGVAGGPGQQQESRASFSLCSFPEPLQPEISGCSPPPGELREETKSPQAALLV